MVAGASPENEEDAVDIVTIYNADSLFKILYLVVFVLNRIIAALFYAQGLKSAIQVGHPMFYKPAKWLSDRV